MVLQVGQEEPVVYPLLLRSALFKITTWIDVAIFAWSKVMSQCINAPYSLTAKHYAKCTTAYIKVVVKGQNSQ